MTVTNSTLLIKKSNRNKKKTKKKKKIEVMAANRQPVHCSIALGETGRKNHAYVLQLALFPCKNNSFLMENYCSTAFTFI